MKDGDYDRIVKALVPLVARNIRNVRVTIGHLREGKEITKNMVLFVERSDYPLGAQFICLRLSTIRKIGAFVLRAGWDKPRFLTMRERSVLDKNAASKSNDGLP